FADRSRNGISDFHRDWLRHRLLHGPLAGYDVFESLLPAVWNCFGVCELFSKHCRRGARRELGFGTSKMTFDNAAFDRRVDRTGLILLILTTAITFFVYSGRAALSLAVGGVLSTVNFHWLK